MLGINSFGKYICNKSLAVDFQIYSIFYQYNLDNRHSLQR